MPTTKDNTVPNGFIDKTAVFELLETTQDYITNIVSAFNVETLKIKGKNYYKIKDLQRVISEVDEFHKTHYSSKYVYKNILSIDILKNTSINSIDIPNHYRGILRKRYNYSTANMKFYKKEETRVVKKSKNRFKKKGWPEKKKKNFKKKKKK